MRVCNCVESCELSDRFTPATRELMVFTKSAKRYFDLDSVREAYKPHPGLGRYLEGGYETGQGGSTKGAKAKDDKGTWQRTAKLTHSGAPPLDWWKIDPDIPYTPQLEGEQMPATFYVGDAIEVMGKLPENSVDLILTSPPFLALRSYLPADHPDKALEGGSQSTPGEFIDWLLDVAEACDRILAPHGSLCIELGDTYSGTNAEGPTDGTPGTTAGRINSGRVQDSTLRQSGRGTGGSGWPLAKSLSLIPESFRWAMVYGRNPFTGRTTEPWRLRNVIRWVRPNPPVGALGDKFRPATSELMVFCKSAKRYFDLDAVRTEWKPRDDMGTPRAYHSAVEGGYDKSERLLADTNGGAPPLDWWNIPLLEGEEETRYGPKEPKPRPDGQASGKGPKTLNASEDGTGWAWERTLINNPLGAPPLDWWEIPPGGYEGAHYAVFPPELCVKPVKAMSPEKVCRVCGEPSRRIVEREYDRTAMPNGDGRQAWAVGSGWHQGEWVASAPTPTSVTESWSDCGHNDWRPGLVLDPFAGSGTTLAVATGHGRDAIGIDLDSRNYDLAVERVGPFILSLGETEARPS